MVSLYLSLVTYTNTVFIAKGDLMINYPNIDPVIFKLGPVSLRWYGMAYIAGFSIAYILVKRQLRTIETSSNKLDIENLFLYLIIGLMIGGRSGYVLFYNLSYYIHNPVDILAIWQGGMSFHGGLIGVVMAGWLFTRKNKIEFWKLSDIITVTVPIGLGLGRLANFINGELFGRVTEVPWGMVFPTGGPWPRHPSQLYEFMLEGVVLFIILWSMKRKKFQPGVITAAFLILYGLFRILVENFREPDVQLGYIWGYLTMGQILSLIMIILGIGVFFYVNYIKRGE
jgi:phosphatidylglycerol:prolipoprotein diacylglycerol transferase